jgi:phage terminase small subunit
MLRIEQEFGLTPSARTGIVADKKTNKEEIDAILFG